VPDQPTDEQVKEIAEALAAGRRIDAIKLYREATGKSLLEAKKFIGALADEMAEKDPERFAGLAQKKGCGSAAVVVAVALALAACLCLVV